MSLNAPIAPEMDGSDKLATRVPALLGIDVQQDRRHFAPATLQVSASSRSR